MTIAPSLQTAAETPPPFATAEPVLPLREDVALAPPQRLPSSAADDPLPNEVACRLEVVLASGQYAEAAAVCAKLLQVYKTSATVWNTLGLCHLHRGALDEALTSFNRARELAPNRADAHVGMADVYVQQRRTETAETHFRLALTLEAGHLRGLNNYANFLCARGRPNEAVPLLERACAKAPDNALLVYNLANAKRSLGAHSDARTLYERALVLKPDLYEARYNFGQLLFLDGEPDRAAAAFDHLLAQNPADDRARAYKLHVMGMLNDFDWVAEYESQRRHLGLRGSPVSPFTTLAMEDNPDLLRVRTQAYASSLFPAAALATPEILQAGERPEARPDRLRIGYFSADFHNHATVHLMSGLLRCHDRSRFEIEAFSYGPRREDSHRNLVRRTVDRFHEAADLSDQALMDLARARKLDLAVDLKGYTGRTRCQIFGQRLAPVQISYLGYPGTLGTPVMDYVVSDSVVSPRGSERHFEEHLIRLPHSYQPNDNQRKIAPRQFTRTDCDLPEEGFIFCCFNNSYKITPREFDVWMRLLAQVEGSVLWLLSGGATSEENLRREARARGVNPQRLIFADRLAQDEHLARQKVADLFLDTFAVNAHTTCSDALWAGLPVLTLPGQQFAARVGASLLTAVGLTDLIATDLADYEARALNLAQDPDKLMALRSSLMVNRRKAPLFDTELYTRGLESAFDAAYDLWRSGSAPAHITVSAPKRTRSSAPLGSNAVAAA